jgi:hypothetical protein
VRTEPARGRLSELFGKALAIEDQLGGRLVLLTIDLIAVSRDIATAVAERVRRQWGLPRDKLLICASHTHCGPEIRPDKVPFFHIPPEFAAKIETYVGWLVARLSELVGDALANLMPARLIARQAKASFAHNRRYANGVDHDVPVMEVTDADGGRRAIVFGYACHNTTMPPEDGRYCGDYAGFAQCALEEREVRTTLFVAGAGADQDPEPRGTLELARRHGELLANAVRNCLTTAGRELTGSLRVSYEEIPLDFQPPPSWAVLQVDLASDDLPARTKAEYLLNRLDGGYSFPSSYLCPIQVVRFGEDLLLIAIGGEPTVDYSLELKRRYSTSGRVVWVAGYANDMFGYVPSSEILRAGGYEGTRSLMWSAFPAPFAETTEERILDSVDRLVKTVDKG